MNNYSVLLFAKDEEERIEFVLRNFIGYAPVIVLDGGSTDRTPEISRKYGAKVVERPMQELGYCNRNIARWCLEQAPTDYVFISYCSLFVPKELLMVFEEVSSKNTYKAVRHGYMSVTYGRYVDRPLELLKPPASHFFKKDAIDVNLSTIHHEWPLIVPDSEILKLKFSPRYSLHVFRDYDASRTEIMHNGYSDIEAIERFAQGERTSGAKMILLMFKEFIKGYFFRKGITGGVPGLLYHMWRAQMIFNIQARIWEHQNRMTRENTQKIQNQQRNEMLRKLKQS